MQTLPPPSAAPDEAPISNSSTGQAVARATAGIGALHLVRFVIGFIAQPLIAHNFGLRWQADAYAISTDIVQRLWLIFEKVINPAFLPNFIAAMKEEGEERAWKLASTAVWLISLALLVVTPLAWWGMPNLVKLLSPTAGPQEIDLTIRTSRALLLGLFFLGFSSLTYTILNGYKRFVYAALGDTCWKLGILGGALVARATHATPERALWLIVAGFVAGAFFKLLPHLLAIGRKWRFLKPQIDLKDPLARKMFALAVPLLIGIIVSESRGFYLQRLADDPSIQVEAGRAALKWSSIIGDNLIQIFPYALSIGIFPFLADLARGRDRQPLTDTLLSALRICVFVFAPITAMLIALRFPLLRAVWESGRLTQADTIAMSPPFVAFTVGLVAFACEMMLSQTYYAMTRAWTPTLIGLATSVLWIVAAKIGVENLGWGLAAIAGAQSLSKTVKCLLMWHLLKPHLGTVKHRDIAVFCLQVVALSIVAALVAGFLITFLAPDAGAARFKLKMLLAVTLSGMTASGCFVVLAAALNIDESRYLTAGLGKIGRKLARR
ncbi:MAG TPA: lipid II flippase MurJ [Abditibacterium sp.]